MYPPCIGAGDVDTEGFALVVLSVQLQVEVVFHFVACHSPFAQDIPRIKMSLTGYGFEAAPASRSRIGVNFTTCELCVVNELPLIPRHMIGRVHVLKCLSPF